MGSHTVRAAVDSRSQSLLASQPSTDPSMRKSALHPSPVLIACTVAILASSCHRLGAQSPILTPSTTPVFGEEGNGFILG